MTAANFMVKAERALEEARLLPPANKTEGTCSRAYYAMFDAAQAALIAAGVVSRVDEIKTHSGLLAVFGKELVLTGRIDSVLSKSLNQVQYLRQLADYTTEPPGLDKARSAVEQAEVFVRTIRTTFDV